ncbi:MAG: hypothetical protein IKE01_03910 [Clostridia bacterium]|nr:hypothetical protein [Clostridia bacterium]
MDKKIALEDGNIIKMNNDEGSIIIDKGYLKNGEPSKILTMSMKDDFGFEVYTFSNEQTNCVDFSIPQYDPLYKHLNAILGVSDSLIIDDDMTLEEKQKYMIIQRQKQDILVSFYNDLKEDSLTGKFIITVINIMRDGRSKIDQEGLDTKERLVKFFRAVENELLLNKEKEVDER